MVVVPTDPPALGSVLYQETATYVWPMFNLNVTTPFGDTPTEGFTQVDGPNMFKKAIELSSDESQVKHFCIETCLQLDNGFKIWQSRQ